MVIQSIPSASWLVLPTNQWTSDNYHMNFTNTLLSQPLLTKKLQNIFISLSCLIISAKMYWAFQCPTTLYVFPGLCFTLFSLTPFLTNPQICSPLGRRFPYSASHLSFSPSGMICIPFPPSTKLPSPSAYTDNTYTQGPIQSLPFLCSSPCLFWLHALSPLWICTVLCTVQPSI